jgi:hypothetical protein
MKMITKDELEYALLLANGDMEFAYLILDFVAKGKSTVAKRK